MRETPIITKVVKRSQTRTDKWSVVLLLDAETEDGSLLLRLTADAAHLSAGCTHSALPSFLNDVGFQLLPVALPDRHHAGSYCRQIIVIIVSPFLKRKQAQNRHGNRGFGERHVGPPSRLARARDGPR